MPKYTLTILSASTVFVLLAYVAMIAATIFFATLRTELSAASEDLSMRVGSLETKYFDAIATLNATDVGLIGYVTPKNVAYVTVEGAPTLTRADR